jgi:Tol biopolymer transport system component
MLYEMVTGARAFQAPTSASLTAAILEHEPAPISSTQPLTPPALERLIRKCLAKDPEARWQSARDVADELQWLRDPAGKDAATSKAPRRGRRLWPGLAAAAIVVATMIGAGATWLLRPAVPEPAVARLSLDVRPAEHLNAANRTPMGWWPTPGGARTAFSWTPDGRALVFIGQRGGEQQLFLRRLDAAEARPLPNTEGAQLPAISSDGQWVAFWAGGAIRKVPLAGGLAIEIARTSTPMGLVWGDQGALYFGNFASDILKVLPNGGLESVTTRRGPDPFASEIWKALPNGSIARVTTRGPAEPYHALPWPLPGERAVLYTARRRFWTWGDEDVVAQPQGSEPAVVVLRHATDARYLPTGHLVFMREGVLFGVGFDAAGLKVVGTPVPLVNGVVQALTAGNVAGVTGAGQFAVSTTGTLAWLPGAVISYPDAALVTVDRRGQVSTLGAQPRSYDGHVQLSPDGRQLAVTILDLNRQSLWVYDLARTTLAPLVLEGEVMWHVWAPGGQHLVFNWVNGGRRLGWQRAEAGTRPDVLATGLDFSPASWTPDGRQLAGLSADDVAVAAVEKGHATMQPLRHTAALEMWPQFSPDGRWIAWGSTVSGRVEIYVAPYPKREPTTLVSVGGGESPRWNPNGRELFFIRPPGDDGKSGMMAVDFTPGAPPHLGVPRTLFRFLSTEFLFRCQGARPFYDVSRDGQRFYVIRRLEAPSGVPVTHISLVQNWFEELKAKVPTGSK